MEPIKYSMKKTPPKPRYIIDEKGNKSSVLLSMTDYRRLLDAWEEVADAEDFAKARATAKKFISIAELRCRLKTAK